MKLFLVLLLLVCSGCASMVLPPKTPHPAITIDQAVDVESDHFPAYSRSLQKSLENTGIFAEVRAGDARGSAPYVVRVNRHVHGNAVIPFLTFISLGIIPTVTEEEFGESLFLDHAGKTTAIDATWKGKTVLGWAALILNLSPNRTSRNPEQSPRFRAYFGAQVAEAIK
jgi:hypothetical protein